MAQYMTNFTTNAWQNFLIPWAEVQLYKRANLWPYVADHTGQLEAMGAIAKGLEFVRDANTGYFTAQSDTVASNDAFTGETTTSEKATLEISENRNIDLTFSYSEVEIGAMTQLGIWAQNQMGVINRFNRQRDSHVMAALKNNTTGAGLAANQTSLTIADASNFINGSGGTEKGERASAVDWLVNVNIELWGRGMDIFEMGGGTPGYGGVIHLVNSEFRKALNHFAIFDVPNGGGGRFFDTALSMGDIDGRRVGGDMLSMDHLMDNTLTAAGDEYLCISFPRGAVKGIMPRRGGMVEGYKYDIPAVNLSGNAQQDANNAGALRSGTPTPIRIIGQRYAYDIELFDKNLVMALKSAVTAD